MMNTNAQLAVEPQPTETLPDNRPSLKDLANTKHIFGPNVYIKAFFVPKGLTVITKAFREDHVTILAHGSVVVESPAGERIKYDAPAHTVFQQNTRYKGKISDVKIYNRFFKDISEIESNKIDLVLDMNVNESNFNNITETTEDIEIVENIVPFRIDGRFYCLSHTDEGFINGRWAKGETTARNEKRFVTEMQQRKIDYKNDGLKTLKYELVNTEMFTDNCLMINVKL